MRGFGLIEIMISLVVLSFGLLTAGQMLFVAASSSSLARSKGAAAILAQDRLESLAGLYQQDPDNPDLLPGDHGPMETAVDNPADNAILNRYRIAWNVGTVPDPRPGRRLGAKRVSVTITPAIAGGAANSKPRMNKILNVSTILGPSMP